jgi:CheY-like chemotaxis protein
MAQEQHTTPPPVALIVDDEPLIRMDTADMVSDESLDVIEARTADEACWKACVARTA